MNPSLRIFTSYSRCSSLIAQLRLLTSPSSPVRNSTLIFLLANSVLALALCYTLSNLFCCHVPLIPCIILNYTRHALSYLSVFERILTSLTENPFGLKLHPFFATFLSSFSILHINLWRSILSSLVPFLIDSFTYFPISFILYLNFTLSASLLLDLLRFFTLPITVLQLYSYKATLIMFRILKQLGLLFIGKNWNPITRRDSSVPLDIDQLVISTLIFISLLFLTPTLLALNVSVLLIWLPMHAVCWFLDYVIGFLIQFQDSIVGNITKPRCKSCPGLERGAGKGVKWSEIDTWVEECIYAKKYE